ncbi:putative Ig domain-containing protein [Krasilnikovia sp. MM14-A1259]|uniref:putative Ig domain-containing protein n=1 Tax=Krasilnikovia sp. MM14-A1259 TaxID=3373539 RepID=UPI00380B6842
MTDRVAMSSAGRGAGRRMLAVLALTCVATLVTGVVAVPSAQAAGTPKVTNPGARSSAVNVTLSLQMTAGGGRKPYRWSATGLPTGLRINTTSGLISGKPTRVGRYTAKVTAADAAKRSGGVSFTWTVATVPVVVNPGMRPAVVGTAVSQAMSATGGKAPYVWSATGLPTGLRINAATGAIVGSPTAAGTWTTKVTASDALKIAGSASVTWDVATSALTVASPGARQSAVGQPTSLTLAAAGGTAPYTWSATGLPAGLTLNAATGVVSGTPTADAGATVTVTATDKVKRTHTVTFGWVAGTAPVVVNPGLRPAVVGAAVSQAMSATGGKAPYVWSATGLPAGLSIDAETGVIAGVPTAAGTHPAEITATDAGKIAGRASFTWDVAAAALTVTSPGTRQSTVGDPATLTPAAAGGTAPYTWTATGLPGGLTLDTATGVVSGTPTATADSTVTVTATDTVGRTGAVTFTWKTATRPTVTEPGALAGTVGVAASTTLTATGGTTPYAWSATGLPAGLGINADTGTVTGTPTNAGDATVTVTVTDAADRSGSATFTWAVAGPITVAELGTQQATLGRAATLQLAAAGGEAPYTWAATALPAGLMLNPATGVVSGTPTSAGATTVTITATDTAKRSASTSFRWVAAAAPVITDPGTRIATVATAAATTTLTVDGGVAPYTWSAAGMPDGMTLSAAGVLSGTPATAGDASVTVTVTDAGNRTGTATFTIAVAEPVTIENPGARNGVVGVAMSLSIAAGGGVAPYTWTATGLPGGLSMDRATGVVAGTPTTAGPRSSTVTVVDIVGRTGTAAIEWTVAAAPLAPVYSLPTAVSPPAMTATECSADTRCVPAPAPSGGDDYAALKTAMDAAAARVIPLSFDGETWTMPVPATVLLDAGTYRLSHSLRLPAYVNLRGRGITATTLSMITANWSNLRGGYLIDHSSAEYADETTSLVSDLTVNGNCREGAGAPNPQDMPGRPGEPCDYRGAGGWPSPADAVGGMSVGEGWMVRQVRFTNIESVRIRLDDPTRHVHISDNRFDNWGGAESGEADNVGGAGAEYVTIEDNQFDTTASGDSIHLVGGWRDTIDNNTVRSDRAVAAARNKRVAGSFHLEGMSAASISGNVLYGAHIRLDWMTDVEYEGGRKIYRNPADTVISGNRVSVADDAGIVVAYGKNPGGPTDDIVDEGGNNVIRDNVVEYADQSGIVVYGDAGKRVPDTLTGNTIRNAGWSGSAFYDTGAGRFVTAGIGIGIGNGDRIYGNTIADDPARRTTWFGIDLHLLSGSPSNTVLTGPNGETNTFAGLLGTPILGWNSLSAPGGLAATGKSLGWNVPGSSASDPPILGYRVYRDGKVVADVPADSTDVRGNLLTADESSFEDPAALTAGWTAANGRTTLSRVGTGGAVGTGALALTSSGAGDLEVVGRRIATTPGQQYTAVISAKTLGAGRRVHAGMKFFDAAGRVLSTTEWNLRAPVDSPAGWATGKVFEEAPAFAVSVQPWYRIEGTVAGEVHLVDRLGLIAGGETEQFTEPNPPAGPATYYVVAYTATNFSTPAMVVAP